MGRRLKLCESNSISRVLLFCPFNDRLLCLMCIMEGDYVASYVGDPNAALSVCDDFFHNAFFELLVYLHSIKFELEACGFPQPLGATFMNYSVHIGRHCPHSANTTFYLWAARARLGSSAFLFVCHNS